MKRRYLILIAVVLASIIGFLLVRQQSYQKVTITLNASVQAKLLKITNTQDDSLANQPEIASFTTSYSNKLKGGSYLLVTERTSDFEKVSRQIEVDFDPINMSVAIDFSAEKLTGMLKNEAQEVEKTLRDKYDKQYWLLPGYSYKLEKGKLFQRGEWYGGLIVPVQEGQDILRVVMKKVDGRWSIATDPPDIILSSVVYPDVPNEILRSVNSL